MKGRMLAPGLCEIQATKGRIEESKKIKVLEKWAEWDGEEVEVTPELQNCTQPSGDKSEPAPEKDASEL